MKPIKVYLNGKEKKIPPSTTISQLLSLYQLNKDHTAIEINKNIVEKKDFEHIEIVQEDCIEIIQMLGGG